MSSAHIRTTFTAAEYLALEAASQRKNEFVGGHIIAMAGGSRAHNLICSSMLRLLAGAFPGGFVFTSGQMLEADGDFYYPDVQVVCGPPTGPGQRIDNPCVIVEVLSPSTADYDRDEKVPVYQRLPSVRDIVLIDPTTRRVSHWKGIGDGFELSNLIGSASCVLQNDATIPLADIFHDADRLEG